MSVNGIPAIAGQQVTPGVDTVLVDGRPVEPALNWTYLMMNKPVGVLTSVGDGLRASFRSAVWISIAAAWSC